MNNETPEDYEILGEFIASDAQQLLAVFEQRGIRFQTKIHDRIQDAGTIGGYGMLTKLAVFIHPDDRREAEALQKEVLKIE